MIKLLSTVLADGSDDSHDELEIPNEEAPPTREAKDKKAMTRQALLYRYLKSLH